MVKPYAIWDVTDWPIASEETLGSKAKDWLRRPGTKDELWLWKATEASRGDDWAEKVAEQLAALLHLPHARYELARRGPERGVISRDVRHGLGALVPGNELLWKADPSYPKEKDRRVSQHTVARVMERIRALEVAPPWEHKHWYGFTGAVLAGYLMFDAWISNQDRHHENWGVIVWREAGVPGRPDDTIELAPSLAPSFDHASSLGQYESDERRHMRLTKKDRGHLTVWATKAQSHFYRTEADPGPLTTFHAFFEARSMYPDPCSEWIERLRSVSSADVEAILTAVPEPLLSPTGRQFALRLLEFNRSFLLDRCSP